MRLAAEFATVAHKLRGVIGLVTGQRAAGTLALTLEQADRGITLGKTRGFGDLHIHRQVLAVLHQHVAHVVELRWLTLTLPKELGLGLVRGDMGLVGTPLAVKVHRGIASRRRRIVLAIPPALERGWELVDRGNVEEDELIPVGPDGMPIRRLTLTRPSSSWLE